MDPVATMKAELAEGVALLRPHYPDDTEAELLARAQAERPRRYARRRRLTHEELAEQAVQEKLAEQAVQAQSPDDDETGDAAA
jgi:hypothetical protein